MICNFCENEIRPFDMFLSVKGLAICETCAEPSYNGAESNCYICGCDLDPEESSVAIGGDDYICSDCANDNMEEYDPEGDYADDWYEWIREELRGC